MAEEMILVHHGIKGQKWGVRNGPPYPLGDDDKSAAEKKAVSSHRSRKADAAQPDKFWTDERKAKAKRVAKGAAITAAVVLAAYGGYKLSQMPAVQERIGQRTVTGLLDVNDIGGRSVPRIGKSISDIDATMVGKINKDNIGRDGEINCAHTSMAYICNTLFGMNVTAKGFSGIDEVSGLVKEGRSKRIFDAAFSGINHISVPRGEAFDRSVKRIPRGTTGVMHLVPNYDGLTRVLMQQGLSRAQAEKKIRELGLSGHFVNFEKSILGRTTIVDSQRHSLERQIVDADGLFGKQLSALWLTDEIMDFSEATISDGADSIFQHCIQRRG